MIALIRKVWSWLVAANGWLIQSHYYDVGHGQGCQCEDCNAERQDLEYW